ncbi:HAD family hydrolase [Haloechinothrix halophila]|uniref:HAD-superfamily subfamily IB hydrolase, TIGR01490 n=1 Tax=Haloechinothrix halophila YIM 93223 TaxID=592678 RepID=W9DNL4_9PSEU|nr:HAD-superfamily subfamily IB hydrolase, TIGR01490 [Haloechinothrix halophila YIM 93223]
MALWRGKDKNRELERLAAMAGEASAEAAVSLEHARTTADDGGPEPDVVPGTLPDGDPDAVPDVEPEPLDVTAELAESVDIENGEAAAEKGQAAAAAAEKLAEDEPGPPQPVAPDLTAAAFFDVDNTMMMGASMFHFARGLAARKYFTTSDLAGFAWQQVKFRVGGKEGDVGSPREQALSFVAGRSVEELNQVGEEIYDELMADKIWSGTKALAQMHLDMGQRVWLVTATPVELATMIARRLGLTGALGTVAEQVDGVYTGRLVGDLLHGRAKAHAVRALAAKEGLNLKRCTAYSDSLNDVPMLSVVGTAVAINPDTGLRDVARQRHWEIRDWRTGRKAAKIGVPSVLGAGAVAGAVAAGLAYRKR